MSKISNLLNPARIDFAYQDQVIAAAGQKPSIFYPLKALFHHAAQATVRHQAVVHYISDNGNYADAARGEIVVRLEDAAALLHAISGHSAPRIQYHDIPSQDTHAAAFDLAQLSRTAIRGFGNVYFANCAPRKKQRGLKGKNGGETVYAGILPNGAIIGGTGEEVFVHFKDLVNAGELNIYKLNIATDGTQFRSRDYFPYEPVIVAYHINRPEINRRWNSELKVHERDQILFGLNIVDRTFQLAADRIPDLQNDGAIVCRVDTHGNLKLGSRHDEITQKFGKDPEIVVYANGKTLKAVIATDSFEKSDGITAISAGSSGRWRTADGQIASPFAEIFTVGGRAQDLLEISNVNLKNGVEVHFIPSALFHDAKTAFASHPEGTDAHHASGLIKAGLVRGLDTARLAISIRPNGVSQAATYSS